ncbi:MAG: hypothetical protein ACJ72E_10015 [Marmoricola sp.]
MTSRPVLLAGSAALLLALSACGSSGKPAGSDDGGPAITATPSAQVTTQPAANAKVIKVTIDTSSLSPVGAEAKISRNQPVVLEIHASVAGQLHVHSSPEQHIDFGVGDSQITLSFDKPGVIAVEDHALNQLIVQLEVS